MPGYTPGEAWWGSPVGSEDEEKPPHNQAGAPGKQGEQDISNIATFRITSNKRNGCPLFYFNHSSTTINKPKQQ